MHSRAPKNCSSKLDARAQPSWSLSAPIVSPISPTTYTEQRAAASASFDANLRTIWVECMSELKLRSFLAALLRQNVPRVSRALGVCNSRSLPRHTPARAVGAPTVTEAPTHVFL